MLEDKINGKVLILNEESLIPWDINPNYASVILHNKIKFDKEIIISPARFEFYDTTIPLKLRLICDHYNVKLTVVGSKNYFPYYSLFAHEVVFVNSNMPNWYNDKNGQSSNQIIIPEEILKLDNFLEVDLEGMKRWEANVPFKDEEEHKIIKLARKVKKNQFADFFYNWKIFILQKSYDKFIHLNSGGFLSHDLTIGEIKKGTGFYRTMGQQCEILVAGRTHNLQQRLLHLSGIENYMSIQILCSQLKNWQYICGGGSANLMSMLPMKTLFCGDGMLDVDFANALSLKRYGESSINYRKTILTGNELGVQFLKQIENIKKWKRFLSNISLPTIEKINKIS